MVKLKKVLTVGNIYNQNVSFIDFQTLSPELYEAFGNPQDRGVWFAWGPSGSGKSNFLLDLVKVFCQENKCIWNELEEELDDDDFKTRYRDKKMHEVESNLFTASYSYDELCNYLDKRNSPKVVVINSAPYFFENLEQYHEFARKYKRSKILIISGHAKGNNPYSEMETKIMFDANKKVFVSGYQAACKGRTIGPNGGFYIIWQEGFEKLRGIEQNKQQTT